MQHAQSTLSVTSRCDAVQPGGTFVAIPQQASCSATFVSRAIDAGATTVVMQKDDAGLYDQLCAHGLRDGVRYVFVPCARRALARYAASKAGNPADQLTIIGVTGSRGKALTVGLIVQQLARAGHHVAAISAVPVPHALLSATAPLGMLPSDELHPFFAQCVAQHITHVVIEASAHALSLHRAHGVAFDHVVLTNFHADHYDMFGSVPRYLNYKKRLFSQCKPEGHAHLVAGNISDELHEVLPAELCFVSTTRDRATDAHQLIYEVIDDSLAQLELQVQEGERMRTLVVPHVGRLNAACAVLAVSVARACGVSWDDCLISLAQWAGIPGHLETFTTKRGVRVLSERVHDAFTLDQLLAWVRESAEHITVVLETKDDRLLAAAQRGGDAVVVAAQHDHAQAIEHAPVDGVVVVVEAVSRVLPRGEHSASAMVGAS